MKHPRSGTLMMAFALLAALLSGCDRGPVDPLDSNEPVALALQVATTSEMVSLIAVEVTGPGIPVAILANLLMIEGAATGSITVPAGRDRTFTARGFDAEGGMTHEGSVTQDVRPGQPAVHIPLVPRGVGVPIEVLVSAYIVAIDPAATEMNIGEERQFSATVTDAEGQLLPVAPAALTWGSSNPAIATVGGGGMVTAGGQPGATRIVVSYEGVAAEAALVVTGDDLLSISLSVSSPTVEPGEPFDVVAMVRNRGGEAVSMVTAWVLVPDAQTISLDGPCHAFPSYGDMDGAAFVCSITDPLAPGEEVTSTFTVRTHLVQNTTLSIRAFIQDWEGPEDPYLGNNEVVAEVSVRDGRVVFASDRDGAMNLYTVRPDGTAVRRLTSNIAAESYPTWSPDRSKIAFVRSSALWIVNADGTGETRLDVPADNGPTWSPDGTRIAVSGRPPGSENRRILIVDLNTGSYTALAVPDAAPYGQATEWLHPDWSPDGTELLAAGTGILSDDQDPWLTRIALDGSSTRHLHLPLDGGCWPLVGTTHPRWSPDKKAIAYNNGGILLDGPGEGGANEGLDCGFGYNRSRSLGVSPASWPAWSPDGEHLVVARRSAEGAPWDLVIVRSDGTGPVRNLTNSSANDVQPHW